ncbi:MAG TPA: TIGR00730 family Rossman fold protein [Candidatus Goldiibacteriota bacterium]|nr:TIGR00730 family Rossman fold protein [Candidatus Goldiibacteriota bacterium]HPI02575.1 TIGR00730 family Rossman fold protein [Candidatus Goldiibacteriota bacterium]HPN64300.1 TIGR00730 family Rossman fold protein [Candidatus Goldiibacteriota bacterium]HRQ43129.1 TIGR00730 family Rossman fold protein [Candidatus Goldiibacteriota bacterium]
MNICVFCASSDAIDRVYFDDAVLLGEKMAKRGSTLVYGGSNRGLMGAIAATVQKHGGKVIGIIPKAIKDMGVGKEGLDEVIIAEGLRERKALMDERSEAFIFLPGGSGTLEEAMELITLKQLHYHDRPLVFLNTNGFYNSLIFLFRKMQDEKFIKPDFFKLFYVAETVDDIFYFFDNYKPEKTDAKWF